MNVEPNTSNQAHKISSLKYQDESNITVKSWEERLKEFKRLEAKSDAEQDIGYSHLADLEVLPPEIHEDLLRAVLFYQQRRVWDDNYQPDLFQVTPKMRKNAVAMMLQDSLHFSIYYTFITNSLGRLYVSNNFEYIYGMVEEAIQNLYPQFFLSEIFKDFKFSHFDNHIIVYPKYKEDIKKIHGLIRLNQFDLGIHPSSIFFDEVKFLEKGFAFRIRLSGSLDLEEILELLKPYEYDLIQSTIVPSLSWTDSIFDRITSDRLQIFFGNRYHRDHQGNQNNLLAYNQSRKIFEEINPQTQERTDLEELSIELTINHPNTEVYTSLPEILTIHADYDVPVNDYDIASFAIDHDRYKLPKVPETLEDDNLTKLIERCKEQRIYKFID